MNELISQLNQPKSQAVTLMNTVGKRGDAKKDAGADFSSLITRASERGKRPEAFPASARGKKAEDTKPAEELVAYAASQAVTNSAAVSDTNNTDSVQDVAAVTNDTAVEDNQEAPGSAEDILTPILGEEDTKQLLSMLGIDISDFENMEPEEAAEFLPMLIKLIDAKINGDAETVNMPETVQNIAAAQDRPALEDMLAMVQLRIQKTMIDSGKVIRDAENAPLDIPALANEAVSAVIGSDSTEGADASKISDTASELTLPAEKQDTTVALESARAKIAEHLAVRTAKDTAEVQDTSEVPEAEAGPKSVEHINIHAESAEVETSVNQAAEETAEMPEEQNDKTDGKKTEASSRAHVTAEPNSVHHTAKAAATEQVQQPAARVNTQNIIDQIVQSARMSKNDGLSQLEIQLRPEHLGKVSILLTSGEDGVTAHIKANNDTVRAMLGGGLGDLMTSLKEMGINMKNINIAKPEMSWDYTRNAGQQQFGREGRNGGEQEQSRQQGRTLRINNTRLPQLSNTLYGTSALQPVMDENVSVDYIA